ncbi:MAG: hypothetical protein CVV42_01305 [Candidatus Riflebacteria bacterium HGW-Riflebacteria-2]|jgi:hypothetical protein|nr:MAG: hypothetical protein CVV42_01305 [Candidatus Riflebacteria bacterium HGW-Riflebacteria-2]
MTQNEFLDYCKKNKTVAFGVPAIIFILLLDSLVLKPNRQKKLEESRGITTQTAPANPAVAAQAPGIAAEKAPLAPPKPLEAVSYPALSERVDSRFSAVQLYPYDQSRNIFVQKSEQRIQVISAITGEEEETFERPDITYHGFFTLGTDRVAILRFADELLLTKVGGALKRSPFFLRSVFPEKIIISDATESIREFEVSLSEKPKD